VQKFKLTQKGPEI